MEWISFSNARRAERNEFRLHSFAPEEDWIEQIQLQSPLGAALYLIVDNGLPIMLNRMHKPSVRSRALEDAAIIVIGVRNAELARVRGDLFTAAGVDRHNSLTASSPSASAGAFREIEVNLPSPVSAKYSQKPCLVERFAQPEGNHY